MARRITWIAMAVALVFGAPDSVVALIGDTPTIRAIAVIQPGRHRPLPSGEPVALIGETPTGRHQIILRMVSRQTGAILSDQRSEEFIGSIPAIVIFSTAYRPSHVLVLQEDLTVLAWEVAFDATGTAKLVGSTPTILGPFGDPALVGTGTSLAEAPNVVDPKRPLLAIGTAGGRVILVSGVIDPMIDGIVDLGRGRIDDLGTVPQVGFFALAAAVHGRLVGLNPHVAGSSGASPSPAAAPPASAVVFDLADPRPHPFTVFSTGAVFEPNDEPLTTPAPVSLVAANGTPSVAVLQIPANPATADSLKVGIIVIGGCPIARVAVGSLLMLEADGDAVLYDPGFTLERAGRGITLTIAGASLDLSPDSLNTKSRGRWVKAVIEVEDGAAALIDSSSPTLEYGGGSVAASAEHPPRLGDADGDGQADLLARFDRVAVQALVAGAPEGPLTLTARWTFRDGSAGSARAQIHIKRDAAAVNPITGEPYTEDERERVKLLRDRFPHNRLVPKAHGASEEADGRRKEAELKEIARKMTAGTARREEIERYYDHQQRLVEARLELVRFVLTEPQWDDKTRARYQRVLDAGNRQLERLAARQQRSLALLKRKQDAAARPPAPVVARIEPVQAEVVQGATASFQAVAGDAGPIVSLKWTLPTDENAAGANVTFGTKALRPGLYEVRLDAVGGNDERSRDTALLQVRPRAAPAFDLAVEAAEAYPLEGEQAGHAELHAVVRNRGRQPVTGAAVRFLLDKQVLYVADGIVLEPGQMRPVGTPPLDAGPLYDKDIVVVIEGAEGEAEEDRDNDRVTVAFGPPTPPPSPETLGTPGVRFDKPPLGHGPLSTAPGALNDIVVETAPLPIDLGPIDGFADLHLHQMASQGYDGRLVWGAADGPDEESAVPQCSGMNHALCWFPGAVIAASGHPWEMGSHAGIAYPQIPCVSSLVTGGIGASTKGWATNATSQRFKHWPIWKTVTHQQVYGGWLEAAHEQGLNLIVMSALTARHLCGVMPTTNGFVGTSDLDDITPAGITNPAIDTAIRTAGPCDDMRNVRRQLLAAWQFDADHDWYEIALTPGQAAQIVQEGKLAVVLAIEASELLDSPTTVDEMREQLDYFVDDLGVRSIQPAHEMDNVFGGASYWSDIVGVVAAISDVVDVYNDLLSGDQESAAADWEAGLGFTRDVLGENVQGLTDLGRQLLLDLMDRELLIDLAHLAKPGSDVAYNIAVARNYYPLYVSHVRYADLLGGYDDPHDDHLAKHWETVQHVKELGGMVGLRTSANRVRTYPPAGVANDCAGSVRDFAQSYSYGAMGMGLAQAFASDMNGFIEQMRPRFADPGHPKYGTRQWACGQDVPGSQRRDDQDAQGEWTTAGTGTDFDLTGFGRIDQIGDLLADLRDNLGVETVQLEDSADSFVEMWQRAGSSFLRGPGDPCIDRSGIVGGPAAGGSTPSPGCPPP